MFKKNMKEIYMEADLVLRCNPCELVITIAMYMFPILARNWPTHYNIISYQHVRFRPSTL